MIGRYGEKTRSLELRKPEILFVPLGWLLAGPLNPASFFAMQVYGRDFDLGYWILLLAIPLSVGCAVALFFLRGGGVGVVTLVLITAMVALISCGAIGPLYTASLRGLETIGIYISPLPVGSDSSAIITSGTFIRAALFYMSVPALPAGIILRLIAFQREAKTATKVSTAGVF